MNLIRNIPLIGSFILLTAVSTSGTIVVQDEYKLGDADPGAKAGGAAEATTVDSIGSYNLTLNGSLSYSSQVPASNVAGAPDTLSMAVSGTGFYEGTDALASTNFGLELYVNLAALTGTGLLVSDGKPASNGVAILENGSQVEARVGGGNAFGATNVTASSWYDLALVDKGGTLTFYVNGVSEGSTTAVVDNSESLFFVGNYLGGGNSGNIDNVRYFTFAQNAFTTSDLQTIPEPASVDYFSLGLLIAICFLLSKRYSINSILNK